MLSVSMEAPVESGVGRCSSGHVAYIMLYGCSHRWGYHGVGVTATGSSPLQCCEPCFVWKEVEERRWRRRICHSLPGFPAFKEPSEQPITFTYCQYTSLREGGCLIWNTPLSLQRSLSKPCGLYASVLTKELQKYPTVQSPFPLHILGRMMDKEFQ